MQSQRLSHPDQRSSTLFFLRHLEHHQKYYYYNYQTLLARCPMRNWIRLVTWRKPSACRLRSQLCCCLATKLQRYLIRSLKLLSRNWELSHHFQQRWFLVLRIYPQTDLNKHKLRSPEMRVGFLCRNLWLSQDIWDLASPCTFDHSFVRFGQSKQFSAKDKHKSGTQFWRCSEAYH